MLDISEYLERTAEIKLPGMTLHVYEPSHSMYIDALKAEENTDVNGSLPQTGSAFGSEMLLGLGGLLTASGALLRRKRK